MSRTETPALSAVGTPEIISRARAGGFRFRYWGMLALASGTCVVLLALNIFRREGYTGDEGFYGVTALNMLHAPGYILRSSYYPLGSFASDKDGFAHLPFNSYFYALSLMISKASLAGPEVVNAIALGLLLFFSYRVLRRFDSNAALFAVLLLIASPAILVSYSQLEAEPLMTTAGIAALYYALQAGAGLGRKSCVFASGLSLGLAFALKLWLCGPLALAAGMALIMRAWHGQDGSPAGRALLPRVAVFAAGCSIPAGLHLLAVGWFYPQDLSYWLKNIYFGVFTNSGISGMKLAGAGVPDEWMHPFWYYGAALYRDHFFLVPIILLGFGSAMRDKRFNRELFWITLAGAAGVLPLSLMKVKEPLYVLSCSIFMYFLAGICLAALVKRISSGEDLDKFSSRFAPFIVIGMLVAVPLAFVKGVQAGKISSAFVAAHSLALSICLVAVLWSRRKRAASLLESSIYATCAVAIVICLAHDFVARRPRDKTIAALIQSALKENQPGALSFIASNFKCYQFYSFRRGCYWHELPPDVQPDTLMGTDQFSRVRAFIFDSEELQKPQIAPWVHWLETHAQEKTAELNSQLGMVSGFRVFIRDSQETRITRPGSAFASKG